MAAKSTVERSNMSARADKHSNNGPERLMLWSEEEDAKLKRPFTGSVSKDEPLSSETYRVRKACLSEEDSFQDELPFTWPSKRKEHS